jgi:hypothetical protein
VSLGRRTAALQTIAEVHGWFTEGFETADLRAVRALLQELDGGVPRRGKTRGFTP